MASSVTPFLMFDNGSAETAMNFYVALFQGTIKCIQRYGPGEPGREGSIKRADFNIAGQDVICLDSPIEHAFTFTPSVSLFVECASEAELDAALGKLSEGGSVLMPADHYGFSAKFAWVNDRFGVSWQLNLQ